MVHQEFMLLPGFTVTENIKLNREITHPNIFSRILGKNLETLDMKAMAADARKALDSVGMSLSLIHLFYLTPRGEKTLSLLRDKLTHTDCERIREMCIRDRRSSVGSMQSYSMA